MKRSTWQAKSSSIKPVLFVTIQPWTAIRCRPTSSYLFKVKSEWTRLNQSPKRHQQRARSWTIELMDLNAFSSNCVGLLGGNKEYLVNPIDFILRVLDETRCFDLFNFGLFISLETELKMDFYQKLWKILRVGLRNWRFLFGLLIERFDWRGYRSQSIESWRQRARPEYARLICRHIGTGFSWTSVRCSRRLSQTWRLRCSRCWTCSFVFDGILHPESGAARSSAIAANDGWFDVWFGLNRKGSNGYCGTWNGRVLVSCLGEPVYSGLNREAYLFLGKMKDLVSTLEIVGKAVAAEAERTNRLLSSRELEVNQ